MKNDNNENNEVEQSLHEPIVNAVKAIVDPVTEQNRKELSFRKYKFWLLGALFVGVVVMNAGAEVIQRYTKLDNNYVAMVKIDGAIAPGTQASPEVINPFLRKAFEDTYAKGVIIHINSPGGTPVAASAIRDMILKLRKEYPDKKVIAVGADYMTSGAYLVATGADTIYANQSSLVGSIGVIVRAFGADKFMERVGVERRVIHAGENKAGMDTFLPFSEFDRVRMQDQLEIIHGQFISMVKESRGDKLDLKQDDIFTGAYWTGNKAKEMGLIDHVGYLVNISEEVFGTSTYKVYKVKKSLFKAITEPVTASITSGLGEWLQVSMYNRPLMMVQ